MRTLIVEDAEGMRKIVVRMLRDLGYDNVMMAANGKEALELMDARVVDLLLTNWNMPVMDGLELVSQVRERVEYANLPILMFTTRASRSDVVTALKAGVNGYLAKPFTPPQLKQRIDFILSRQAETLARQVAEVKDPMRREDSYPLMVIGDATSVPSHMLRPEHQPTLHTLADVATSVRHLNAGADSPLVGVVMDHDSGEISRWLRFIGSRVKLLMLSTKVHGGGLTLARLTSINKRSDLSVALIYDQRAEIPDRERMSLSNMGVQMYERGRLDASDFQQLLLEGVMSHGENRRPSELPTPKEIRQRLQADIRTTVTLPVLPKVFSEITQLSNDTNSEFAQWTHAIERDPLAAAQLVRRSRSPLYGFRGEVRQLDQAVVLLGKDAVREIIVSDAVQRAFQLVSDDAFEVEDFGSHSLAVAHVAQLLAIPLEADQRTPEQQKNLDAFALNDMAMAALERAGLATKLALEIHEDPFVAGIMHDIGKVALVHSYPGLYKAVIDEMARQRFAIPMRVAEESVAGGADHTVVGGILADTWQLGDAIGQIISEHHHPSTDNHLVDLVALADVIANAIFPLPGDAIFPLARMAGTLPVEGEPEAEPTPEAAQAASDTETEVSADELAPFLPEGLLGRLGIAVEQIVELTQALAPSVRQRVLNTQSGSEGGPDATGGTAPTTSTVVGSETGGESEGDANSADALKPDS
ncbi:MAG: HDOD domain-containing protein [Gemmatimonadetes bacterium]|nr:HDOD domain-containing protein [Gemmatimonadota bacterium]MBT5146184.1 HDOD domain-containing protein [Gemmatimonadota bacterium]MBT5590827.1 HDOD domain-containing protein [Gemmatimonadota bacterium]MBT5961285.1 HDOD domain-containing protein [Gemmatimonadota bacterium]MBT7454374.1 HDOD domain-containing protein [Gemmatimonadota bacterium]